MKRIKKFLKQFKFTIMTISIFVLLIVLATMFETMSLILVGLICVGGMIVIGGISLCGIILVAIIIFAAIVSFFGEMK